MSVAINLGFTKTKKSQHRQIDLGTLFRNNSITGACERVTKHESPNKPAGKMLDQLNRRAQQKSNEIKANAHMWAEVGVKKTVTSAQHDSQKSPNAGATTTGINPGLQAQMDKITIKKLEADLADRDQQLADLNRILLGVEKDKSLKDLLKTGSAYAMRWSTGGFRW